MSTAESSLVATLVLLAALIGGVLTCCCFCCAVPICSLFFNLFCTRPTKSTNVSDIEYQMIDIVPSANAVATIESIPIAEAYIIPPLAVSHARTSSYSDELASSSSDSRGFKDVWAAFLFLLNAGLISWCAFQTWENIGSSMNVSSEFNYSIIEILSISFLGAVLLASCFGSCWLSCLIKRSEGLIHGVLWSSIILFGCLSVVQLASGNFLGAVMFALFSIITFCYYGAVRDRIPFASSVLSTACSAVQQNYCGLLSAVYSLLVMQILWFFVWGVASYGILHTFGFFTAKVSVETNTQELSAGQWTVLFLLFLSMFWGTQLISAVLQTTVAGTVAIWWFDPSRQAVVRGSAFRALTTSFGSLCFGSLLIAILQAIRETLNVIRQSSERRRNSRDSGNVALRCALGCIDWMLSCLEALLVYFNKYAYCYIAAYGQDFITSGRKVTQLFTLRGMTAIINDSLISRTLTVGTIFLALFTGFFGALVTYVISYSFLPVQQFEASVNMTVEQAVALSGALSFVLGLSVAVILTNALESAVAMVFVCFAEDPLALQKNHFDEFVRLLASWDVAFPEVTSHIFAQTVVDAEQGGSGRSGSGSGSSHYYDNGGGGGGGGGGTVTGHVVRPPVVYSTAGRPPPLNPNYVDVSSHAYQCSESSSNSKPSPPPFNPNYRPPSK